MASPGRQVWFAALAAASVALALRVGMILAMPVMPSGDGYTRLGRVHELFLYSWLPVYQGTLRALSWMTAEPQAFRVLTAVQGAAGAAAVALLVGARARVEDNVGSAAAALVAGLVVALCPAHVMPAAGLYQEPLFVLLLAGGYLGLARGRAWGAVLLLLCTWTRYEGWAAALVALLVFRSRLAWVPLLGPAAWIVRSQLVGADPGAGIDFAVTAQRFTEQARILRSLVPYWIGWPLLAVGALGALRGPWDRAEAAVLALAAVDIVSVAIFRPFSPPDNARQLVLPALALAVLAGRLAAGASRWTIAAIIVVIALPLARVLPDMRAWTGEVDQRRAAVGVYLGERVLPGERVLVVSPGEARWPGVEPEGCLFVAVWARLPRDRVVCDTEVPDGDVRAWLDAENVAFTVVLGEGASDMNRRVAGAGLTEVREGVFRRE